MSKEPLYVGVIFARDVRRPPGRRLGRGVAARQARGREGGGRGAMGRGMGPRTTAGINDDTNVVLEMLLEGPPFPMWLDSLCAAAASAASCGPVTGQGPSHGAEGGGRGRGRSGHSCDCRACGHP
jgi:hypothetical protein